MKRVSSLHAAAFAVALLTAALLAKGATTTGTASGDFPASVIFELGYSEFAPGDSITITSIHGTAAAITTNETYCIEGDYTLASRDSADLSFFATVPNSGSVPIDPRQTMHIAKGSGTFRLIKDIRENGFLHVSFYQGGSFGGIYFGQGDWVRRNKGWGHTSSPVPEPGAGPNAVIFQFLGQPVQPPANLETAYSKRGLIDAVETAARNAGVTLKHVEIDDSEFPFLVGIICEQGDWPRLKEQLTKLDGYEYNGGVAGGTCSAIDIIPWKKYPTGSEEQINRRRGVREMMLYEKLSVWPEQGKVSTVRSEVGEASKESQGPLHLPEKEDTYTITSVIQVLNPVNPDDMNDDFQNVRVLHRDKDSCTLEITYYPLFQQPVGENPNWREKDAGITEYLKPTPTENWDETMRRDLINELHQSGIEPEHLTDKELVEKVSAWAMHRSHSVNSFCVWYVYFPDGKPAVYPQLRDAFDKEKQIHPGRTSKCSTRKCWAGQCSTTKCTAPALHLLCT